MNNKLLELALNVNNKESNDFLTKTNSNLSLLNAKKQVVTDYSWIALIDESIPYIDAIIRNPRRFIAQEEELAPVEKTKKVTKETIKHLSQHTGLIQDVDEDGMVLPLKLLNVYKEETIDLYENRFIYSLIKNLFQFLKPLVDDDNNESYFNSEKKALYAGKSVIKDETVQIEVKYLQSKKVILDDSYSPEEIKEKKEYFRQITSDFMSSLFMKTMNNATPVRSPIRKTNVILKDPNFQKALELWEFLEGYQIEKPTKIEESQKDLSNDIIKNDFNWIYYEIYNRINSKKENVEVSEDVIYKLLLHYLNDNNISELKFRNKMNKYLDNVIKNKINREILIKKCYNEFINKFDQELRKAVQFLK